MAEKNMLAVLPKLTTRERYWLGYYVDRYQWFMNEKHNLTYDLPTMKLAFMARSRVVLCLKWWQVNPTGFPPHLENVTELLKQVEGTEE